MKSVIVLSFASVVGLLMVCDPTSAHHGNSSYDDKNPIALKGTVTQFIWSNPHSLLFFDVKDDKGNVVHWTAEALSPGRLSRAGWTKDSLKPGDQVTVILMPAKNGAPLGHFHQVVFADGKKLDVGEECLYCPGNPNFKSEPKEQ
jgi:uncharacterized protein DUF6152